jgi:hypothetical protein
MTSKELADLLELTHGASLDTVTVGVVFSNGIADQPRADMPMRAFIAWLRTQPETEMGFDAKAASMLFGGATDTV